MNEWGQGNCDVNSLYKTALVVRNVLNDPKFLVFLDAAMLQLGAP